MTRRIKQYKPIKFGGIRELADRIEGKPSQAVTLGGEGGGAIPFVNVSPAENEKRIMELLAKAGGAGDNDSAD